MPFYYVAPMSKDSLAHAQIYPEFLSVEKQNKAAAPEFPFTHDEAIENGRLKIFEHATEGLSEHFKGPAVIFTGHPSLELGQVNPPHCNYIHFTSNILGKRMVTKMARIKAK